MYKKPLLAVTIATILSTGMLASQLTPVFAADDAANTGAPAGEQVKNKQSDRKETEADQDLVKVSDDALLSMRDLHSARLAIFNGNPVQARTFVDAAVTRIDSAVKDADRYALDIKAPKADDEYVPYGASLTVLDAFEPTDTKAEHIAKANEHLHKGEQKEALEALKLGEVDVAIATDLVPVKFAREHIAEAADLIGQGKYYEANLALKAVDDAVFARVFAIDETPGTKGDSDSSSKD